MRRPSPPLPPRHRPASLATLVAATVLTAAPAVARGRDQDRTGRSPSAADATPGRPAASRGSINVKRARRTAGQRAQRGRSFHTWAIPSRVHTAVEPRAVRAASTPEIAATPPVPVTPTTEPARDRSVVGRLRLRRRRCPAARPVGRCRTGPCRPDRQHGHPDVRPRRERSTLGPTDIGIRGVLRPPARFRQLRPARSSTTACTAGGSARRSAGPATSTATPPPIRTRPASSTSSCRGRPTRPAIWDLWFFGFLNKLPDFPAPGTSTDKLAFTANFFTVGCSACGLPRHRPVSRDRSRRHRLDRRAGARGIQRLRSTSGAFEFGTTGTFDTFFTATAGVQVPATSSTLHVVAQHIVPGSDRTDSYYVKITGTVAAARIAAPFESDLTDCRDRRGDDPPPDPLQPGGTRPSRSAIDARPTDAIWQNGLFTWVSTNGCTPDRGLAARATASA